MRKRKCFCYVTIAPVHHSRVIDVISTQVVDTVFDREFCLLLFGLLDVCDGCSGDRLSRGLGDALDSLIDRKKAFE
jgi:hypothetical protein